MVWSENFKYKSPIWLWWENPKYKLSIDERLIKKAYYINKAFVSSIEFEEVK